MTRYVRYPIYIPSKGRADRQVTAATLDRAGLGYHVVVGPSDRDAYAESIDPGRLLVLPEDDLGLVYSRNFCKDHATSYGSKRHWQIDDDVDHLYRNAPTELKKKPICDADLALSDLEGLVDQFTNVGIAGFASRAWPKDPGVVINKQVFTCILISNDLPHRWREGCIEDTDYTLQVLVGGSRTLTLCDYLFSSPTTGTKAGGNNSPDAYAGDARLRRIRGLQRNWPGLIGLTHQRGLPRAKTAHLWRKFDKTLLPTATETRNGTKETA